MGEKEIKIRKYHDIKDEAEFQKWKGLVDRDRNLDNTADLSLVGCPMRFWTRLEKECAWIQLKAKELPKDFLFEDFNRFTNYLEIVGQFLEKQPIHYDKNKIWWIWDNHSSRYEMVDETDLLNAIDEKTKSPTTNSGVKHEILEAMKRKGRLRKPKESQESWVQFKDKIIDLETGTEFVASPDFFITNPIDLNIGESEDTPTIDKLFTEWVGEEHKQELYEILAFCLVPSYFINRMFCLIGAGANGKSTYLKILEKFIGDGNITSSSLYLLLKQRFEGNKLYKKLVCLMGETTFNLLNNTDFLKKLSGQDLVRVEFKGKDSFDFRNYAKLIMATNSLPPTADKTVGFYRRWHIIKFPNRFNEEKDVLSNIPKKEYDNLALKCLNIAKKLWVDREFTNDGDFEERKKRYEEESNPLMKFINENYERDINGVVIFSDFSDGFIDFLEERGYRVLSKIAISQQLKAEGFEIKVKSVKIDGTNINARWILGLKIKGKTKKVTHITDITQYSTCSPPRKLERKVSNKGNKGNFTQEEIKKSGLDPKIIKEIKEDLGK